MNEYELALVQRAQIHIDNSGILQEYFKIYPCYRSRVCGGEVNSALITSCVTWPLFLWRITFWFQLALVFLSLKVTCAYTRKSHDANCDACMWRGSWTIHLNRRLTFSRLCMEICVNRPQPECCLFSLLVGNTQGCRCVRLHHAINENLDPGWKWAVVCTIQPFYSPRAKRLLDGYHYCLNIREVPGSILNLTRRLYLLKERCSFPSVIQCKVNAERRRCN
jgi:hypothetical protein